MTDTTTTTRRNQLTDLVYFSSFCPVRVRFWVLVSARYFARLWATLWSHGVCGVPSSAATDRASGRASAAMRPSEPIHRMRSWRRRLRMWSGTRPRSPVHAEIWRHRRRARKASRCRTSPLGSAPRRRGHARGSHNGMRNPNAERVVDTLIHA